MARKRRGLGSLGVDALLSSVSSAREDPASEELRLLPIESLRRGQYQPRNHIDPAALEELAESIRAQGVVQPVVARPVADGFELIAGERRWRAAQLIGMAEIPTIVKEIPDQAAAAMSLIENIQREDLNPLEEANAFQRLIEEFELTHQEVADTVGRSRTAVTNILRLQELQEDVKALVNAGELEMGHARALLGLQYSRQSEAARHVVARGMSVRETERHVKSLLEGAFKTPVPPASPDPDVENLQRSLSEKLGAPVSIQHNPKGRGKLVIRYSSLDELDGILMHIK
ncbi:MAG: ParB/RepB/Spo0J family partition protein [Gammaproteobacteria bacterium]